MTIRHHMVDYERLSSELLATWKDIPTSIIGDCLNRSGCMSSAIKPLRPNLRFAGHARTVQTMMVGDNSALHAAIPLCHPGDALVVDGGGFEDIAIWGGLLTRAAIARGVVGIVIDGGCRDAAEIREIGFPVYCRSVSPRGPHKGFGGVIDCAVSVGGVAVSPGDILVGDDDGVAVVPLESHQAVLTLALKRIAIENAWTEAINSGQLTTDLMNLPKSTRIE